MRFITVLMAVVLTSACSSGGGGGGDTPPISPPPPPPPPPPSAGEVSLEPGTLSVAEAAGAATLTVTRSNGSAGDVTVDILFESGTADTGDASIDPAVVSFADGDTAPRSITVSIVDDVDAEPDESFVVRLGNPTGGLALGAQTGATVTIEASDQVAPPTGDAPALNDTGATSCATATERGLDCSSPDIVADYPNQDGASGRDPMDFDDTDGVRGFSFTKLGADGSPLADQSVDYATTPWTCVRDEVTQRVWEIKTGDAGLRDRQWTYSWYSTRVSPVQGFEDVGECETRGRCDTEKYVREVNEAGLCGFDDWRLPSSAELQSIVHYESGGAAIDGTFFPNAEADLYWSATPSSVPGEAEFVGFRHGEIRAMGHDQPLAVRLVRGGD